jgi:hypothetical protein
MPRGAPMSEESTPEAWEVPVQDTPSTDGVSLGAVSIEVDEASPNQAMTPGVHFGTW